MDAHGFGEEITSHNLLDQHMAAVQKARSSLGSRPVHLFRMLHALRLSPIGRSVQFSINANTSAAKMHVR